MRRRQIGNYFEILHGGGANMIDWRNEFREYDLPLIEENQIFYKK